MKLHTLLLSAGLLSLTGAAQAALHDRGGGMIYDDVLNITWLQDANYAKTSGYDYDGLMAWSDAVTWASQLVYGGFTDWRLPETKPVGGTTYNFTMRFDGTSDKGYNITSQASEMAYMYYVNLSNMSRYDANVVETGCATSGGNSCLENLGPFVNLKGTASGDNVTAYWSGTDDVSNSGYAWNFFTGAGGQFSSDKTFLKYAWAVRDGDVSAPVPEPETYALMLAGLGLVGWVARRRAA